MVILTDLTSCAEPQQMTMVAKSSNRGSKPGERRGGRQKNTPNKSTKDVKALASKYTDAAMQELGRLATGAESESARVAAIKELFDRAYGRPTQTADVAHTLTGVIGFRWQPPTEK